MKAIELYLSLILFIMLYKVVLTFDSVAKIVKCEDSDVGTELLKFFEFFMLNLVYVGG